MGEGLKRVAKQCGGLIAADDKTEVHYGADGKVIKKVKRGKSRLNK